MNSITVCVATIAPRAALLARALASITTQTLLPECIIVEYDYAREGAPIVKNRALAKVDTPLVAWLDDDDEFMPHHLSSLLACLIKNDASLVYSIPYVPEVPEYSDDPKHHYHVPFDEEVLRRESFIQTTVLVRTSVIRAGGGFWYPPGSNYDDHGMALGVLNAGGKIVHLPEYTFQWHHYGVGRPGVLGNTSGSPNNW